MRPAFLKGLRPLARLSAADSLGIYQSAVAESLHQALRDIFPVCAAVVGADCFRGMARRHQRSLYSEGGGAPIAAAAHSADLGRCGEGFPELIGELEFLSGVPYLADVARLEWAWHDAFTAPGSAPPPASEAAAGGGGLGRLAEVLAQDPAQWRFVAPPSAHLFESHFPVLAIWQAHRPDASAEGDLQFDASREIDFEAGDDRLMVWRRGLDLRIDRVEDGWWPLLAGVVSGCSVAEMLTMGETTPGCRENLTGLDPEDFAPVLNSIQAFFARGWIVGCEPLAG